MTVQTCLLTKIKIVMPAIDVKISNTHNHIASGSVGKRTNVVSAKVLTNLFGMLNELITSNDRCY